VCQVGYLQRLYRDAPSTEHKSNKYLLQIWSALELSYLYLLETSSALELAHTVTCICGRREVHFK